jgi:antagonist of KipI
MSNTTKLHFKKAGLQTLIQDQGRHGYQSFGVPTSGAMDKIAAALANELLENHRDTPVLEITLLGPTIQFEGACQIAITGANLSPKINRKPIANYEIFSVKDGDILSFGAIKNGCRAYLAIRGKWSLSKWLGSFSALPYASEMATPQSLIKKNAQISITTLPTIPLKQYPKEKQPPFTNNLRVRVLPGPEFEEFSRTTIAYFFSRGYQLTNDSNRMGYRLNANIIDFSPKREVISSGIIPGTIQITSAGQPVILMADAQTVGGYYRIANVLSEDMNKLAQLKPGDTIWFSLVAIDK